MIQREHAMQAERGSSYAEYIESVSDMHIEVRLPLRMLLPLTDVLRPGEFIG